MPPDTKSNGKPETFLIERVDPKTGFRVRAKVSDFEVIDREGKEDHELTRRHRKMGLSEMGIALDRVFHRIADDERIAAFNEKLRAESVPIEKSVGGRYVEDKTSSKG